MPLDRANESVVCDLKRMLHQRKDQDRAHEARVFSQPRRRRMSLLSFRQRLIRSLSLVCLCLGQRSTLRKDNVDDKGVDYVNA